MTEAAVSATSALNAVVLVFALMTVFILVVFALTMVLAVRHRRQRLAARKDLNNAKRWAADPAGRLDNLTVGDLVGDPRLRQAVLSNRSQLADIVATRDATKDATDSGATSRSDPDTPPPG